MEERDLELYNRFKAVVKEGLDEKVAIDFFASLQADDYDRLIDIFVVNDDLGITEETREKILIILRKLRARV